MSTSEATLNFIIEGRRLSCTVAGSPASPPLLLLHGFVSHRGVWRQSLTLLKERYYCIAVDLLGFGASDKPPEADYSPRAQAQRILRLADGLGFRRFGLIGHSMGGQIALYLAARLIPQRITRLLTIASVVTGQLTPVTEQLAYPQIVLGMAFPWLYGWWRQLARYPWYAAAMFRPWFYRLDAVPFQEWAVDREMALQPGIHLPAYRAAEAIRRLDLTPDLVQITAPTWVIVGQQDRIVPVTDSLALAQHVPHSRLIVIDRCGHFPMYEHPQRYADILKSWGFSL